MARRNAAATERYSRGWLLERHGYLTPAHARESLIHMAAMIGPPSCPESRVRFTVSGR